jgi:protein-S-isoprenylcysteine O-methyltransferase Ste14
MSSLELKIPPPLVMLCMAGLMWLLAKGLPLADLSLPYQSGLGLLATSAGACLIVVSVGLFIRAKTTIEPTRPGRAAHLVVGGFNRVTRNPMYLGMLFWLLAWGLWLGNGLALLGLPLFVLYINRFQIIPEERFLREKFGEEYQAYCARVRRWI